MKDRLTEILKKCFKDANSIEELAEKLIDEGVIVPPCKVGQTVYKTLITDDTKEPAIWEIVIKYGDIDMRAVSENSYLIGRIKDEQCAVDIDFCDFGKTVFLTREEAEKALERS